jgi:pimeloyl-ACP methyl ester carboxylesterase
MGEPKREAREPRTKTLDRPGVTVTYDIRAAEAATRAPVLLMVGCPMDASGFTTLAEHFPERTVVTYDPRGVSRSRQADGASWASPEEHADDLHHLIGALETGPADVFASSGGAVNALALLAQHPEQVRTLVAHEPPAATALPDREQALAAIVDTHQTYERDGLGPGMAKFMAMTTIEGPIPADLANPPPSPHEFGLPAEDDGTRDNPMLGRHIIACTHYEHDVAALRAASTRIVIGAGAESAGTFTHRAALAVAEQLGTEAMIFPSHHGGFLGGEFGWRGQPDAFAATLRQVIGEND